MDEDENDGRSSGRTRQHSESSDPKEMFKRTKPSDGGDGDENVSSSSSSVASSPPRYVHPFVTPSRVIMSGLIMIITIIIIILIIIIYAHSDS